jgi:hypothetical protein
MTSVAAPAPVRTVSPTESRAGVPDSRRYARRSGRPDDGDLFSNLERREGQDAYCSYTVGGRSQTRSKVNVRAGVHTDMPTRVLVELCRQAYSTPAHHKRLASPELAVTTAPPAGGGAETSG